mgnify:CR=1 FL=1
MTGSPEGKFERIGSLNNDGNGETLDCQNTLYGYNRRVSNVDHQHAAYPDSQCQYT